MKNKIIFLIFIIFLFKNVSAQNWQTFLSNQDRYFKGTINGGSQPVSLHGLVRAFHTDSIALSGSDSIFYLFKSVWTTTGICVNQNGPSWLGDKVIVKTNGDNIFFNVESDSIIISTQAPLNGSFIMYHFTNGDYIQALVTSISVDSVLGVFDSLKTISVNAKDIAGNAISNPFNGTTFTLSKNNGMVSNLIWSEFPLYPDSFLFSRVNEGRLTFGDIYDFGIGDIFQFRNGCYVSGSLDSYNELEITGKWFSQNNDTVFYQRKNSSKIFTYIFVPSPIHIDSTLTITIDTVFYVINNYLFNGAYPEQSIIDTSFGYGEVYSYLLQSGLEFNGRAYITYILGRYIWFGTCFATPLEPIVHMFTAFVGGGSYQSKSYDSTVPAECFSWLLYFKKGSEIYGTPIVINSVEDVSAHVNNSLIVFPNPANATLTVQLFKIKFVIIYNTLGEIVLQNYFPIAVSEQFQLDISFFPSGIYFIKADNLMRKFIKQ